MWCTNDCDNCEGYCEYDNDIDLSNYEWCSLAECYVDTDQCKNIGCENCRHYIYS